MSLSLALFEEIGIAAMKVDCLEISEAVGAKIADERE